MAIFRLTVVVMLLLQSRISFQVEVLDPYSDEFIESINREQSLWKAGRNFGPNISRNHISTLLGLLPLENRPRVLPVFKHNLQRVEIPERFDWRDHLPECSTLRQIRDQGSCGSCWAFAAVETISDRICIHSQGRINVQISAQNLVSCCKDCGNGCEGGLPDMALDYWKYTGIVSGGAFNSSEGCQPYEISPCMRGGAKGPLPPCEEHYVPTPKCKDICESSYPELYKKDLHFGENVYCVASEVEQIQTEIMKNGPVIATFEVYEDFLHYQGGVYKYCKGEALGSHAVKIIGWGVEDDTPYWLIANSWNTHWGDRGYVKMLLGHNHCNIEKMGLFAGIPAGSKL